MYEIIFFLTTEEVKTIQDTISSLKGKVTLEEKWGKKTLAYPIKKHRSAFYYRYGFDMKRENIQELKKKLNFNDNLIRYLLLKVD